VNYELVTAPASEPITLAEAKEHCRVDISTDDSYITALITSAREYVERVTGRALITQTWSLTLDAWPTTGQDDWWDGVRDGALSILSVEYLEIRRAPFLAVTSISTLDEDAAETTWDATNYYTTKQQGYGRVVRKRGVTWPIPGRDRAGIKITFTLGYGANASDVPSSLRQAVLFIVAHWYEIREPALDRGKPVPHTIDNLLASYRVMR